MFDTNQNDDESHSSVLDFMNEVGKTGEVDRIDREIFLIVHVIDVTILDILVV